MEASKIAGHAEVNMTAEYTLVSPERQNELTRRIQARLAKAAKQAGKQKKAAKKVAPAPTTPPAPAPAAPGTPEMPLATRLIQ